MGRLTKLVILVSQHLAKGHIRESDLEPGLDRNRAKSTNSAHKRSIDDEFGRYLIIEHNDILCARCRLTKFVILVSQRLAKGHTRESDLEPRLHINRAKSTNLAH